MVMEGIAAAALNTAGQLYANKQTERLVRDQMDFQERMSSTAYQRQMQDMRQAGLNPILAYNSGGASTPSGASATIPSVMSGAVSSALDARRAKYEVRNLEKQNELIEAQSAAARSQDMKNFRDALLAEAKIDLTNVNAAKAIAETSKIDSDKYRLWVDTIGDNLNPLKWLNKRLSNNTKVNLVK